MRADLLRSSLPRTFPALCLALLALLALLASPARGEGPFAEAGDPWLRADVQRLADAGLLPGPVATWPLAWEAVREALRATRERDLDPATAAALGRVARRAEGETVRGTLRATVLARAAEAPRTVRTFLDSPREEGELGAAVSWMGEGVALRLAGRAVADADDGDRWRADGSYLALALGNWTLSGSVLDRHWGPGWQSSLIYSANARPIPALALDRRFTDAFESRWLAWLGPWDASFVWGFLEGSRAVSDARLFTGRIDFRPRPGLEFGITGMGLWCGDGQPCGAGTFLEMIAGGGSGDDTNPDGNNDFDRLLGLDARWSLAGSGVPVALYAHVVGEDFGDGASRFLFPTAVLGQFGVETWGSSARLGGWRAFLEWADTECDFALARAVDPRNDDGRPGCAYRNGTYRDGQTFKGRVFAHGADQDSSLATAGLVLDDVAGGAWSATFAYGLLNRRGASRSTVVPRETEYAELELVHRRSGRVGGLTLGLGYAVLEDRVTGEREDDPRAFAEWRVRLP